MNAKSRNNRCGIAFFSGWRRRESNPRPWKHLAPYLQACFVKNNKQFDQRVFSFWLLVISHKLHLKLYYASSLRLKKPKERHPAYAYANASPRPANLEVSVLSALRFLTSLARFSHSRLARCQSTSRRCLLRPLICHSCKSRNLYKLSV